MDFDFTEDQQALRDAVRRFVDKDYSFERRHQIARNGGFDRAAWDALAGLGLTALAVPEAHGGLGFGPVEAMVVMEELGRGLVLEPVAQGALIAPAVLARAPEALQAAWLPRIAQAQRGVVAHRAGQLQLHLHVGHAVAQRLEAGDRDAELLAGVQVIDRHGQVFLHHPDGLGRLRGDADVGGEFEQPQPFVRTRNELTSRLVDMQLGGT